MAWFHKELGCFEWSARGRSKREGNASAGIGADIRTKFLQATTWQLGLELGCEAFAKLSCAIPIIGPIAPAG